MDIKQVDKPNYLTVKALTQYIKLKFDKDPYLRQVYVVGEVSNFRERRNGHQYFSLKDDDAKIDVVMFRSAYNKVPFQLEEGMKVFATGNVTVYERGGNYQMILDTIEPDGVGALYQALEQLKKKMAEQGVFNLLNRPLAKFPKHIAVITSPTGAVIRDILTTIQRRFPIVEITVFPTRVQGKEAVGEIVQAFQKVEDSANQYDTIILARGGGSIEDLWCFNDEAVARAILNASAPVISSVGHETDTTIADLVADVRAATPTAAAELAVPVLTDVLTHVNQQRDRLIYSMTQRLNFWRKQLDRTSKSYVLQQPERLYQPFIQQLDYVKERMVTYQKQYFKQQKYQMKYTQQRLDNQNPIPHIQQLEKYIQQQTEQMLRAFNYLLQSNKKQIGYFVDLLDAHSPLKILTRGYAMVEQEGKVVSSIDQVEKDQLLNIHLSDGDITALVQDIYKENLDNDNVKGIEE